MDLHIPRTWQLALICIYAKFLPVPKVIHMSAAGWLVSMVRNFPLTITTTWVSTGRTKQVVEPLFKVSCRWFVCFFMFTWLHAAAGTSIIVVPDVNEELLTLWAVSQCDSAGEEIIKVPAYLYHVENQASCLETYWHQPFFSHYLYWASPLLTLWCHWGCRCPAHQLT